MAHLLVDGVSIGRCLQGFGWFGMGREGNGTVWLVTLAIFKERLFILEEHIDMSGGIG
jgi:hypothetical protein